MTEKGERQPFVSGDGYNKGGLLGFFTTIAATNVVATACGSHTLEANFRSLGEER
jgi:hypothetical protein